MSKARGAHNPDDDREAALWLLSAAAVRDRAEALFARAARGESANFTYVAERLDATVGVVLDTIADNYPDRKIPFHSRWRHFEVGGVDRWGALSRTINVDAAERARVRFDLAVTSVLLDAGTGSRWSYLSADGARHARSEGLGLASLAMFAGGLFSNDPRRPLRCDADALATLEPGRLAAAMQVSADNPLAGIEGRAALLQRLGQALSRDSAHFGTPGRIGNLYDFVRDAAGGDGLPAGRLLAIVLAAFGPIWPGRHSICGLPLGDCWPHSAFARDDAGRGLVPLHKLSQWLTYSLIEPLEEAGVRVTDLDNLTGLAEYRNGGLMLDAGVLALRNPALARHTLDPTSELVVEWRALTVALLDRVAAGVRTRLAMDAQSLPLARVLEGGTWAAGRRLARERRADGGPPLTIASDGTIF